MGTRVQQPVDTRSGASPSLLAHCGPLCRLTMSVGTAALCMAIGMAAAFGIEALRGVAPGWPGGPYRVSPKAGLIAWAASVSIGMLVVMLWFVWRRRWVQLDGAPLPRQESRARMVKCIAATIAVVAMAGYAVWKLKGVPVVPGDRTYLTVTVWLVALAALSAVWTPAVYRLDGKLFAPVFGLPIRVFCPGCGYDLHGLSNLTCPECGQCYSVDELLRAQCPAAVGGTPGVGFVP